MSKKGFTLVELLVVIAIISILTSIVLVSLSSARSRSRDARRVEDLVQIRNAFYMYYDKNGNWIEKGSGCGGGGSYGGTGNGWGWFNYKEHPGFYPESIAQCLVDAGATPSVIIDPTSGKVNSTPSNNIYTYMKSTCVLNGQKKTFIYAKMENLEQSSRATDNTCDPSFDTLYGMNYYIEF